MLQAENLSISVYDRCFYMDLEIKNGAVDINIRTKEYKYTFASFGRGGAMAGEIQIGQLTFVGKYVIYLEKPESVKGANLAWIVGSFAWVRASLW